MDSDIELEYGNSCPATIKSSERITPESTEEVRSIILQIDEPAFRIMEGQNIGVLIPGPHPFGNKYHHRYYSIANARDISMGDSTNIELLVRRCSYIDEVSGESYPGIASNYLCDAKVGDQVTITGPYKSMFRIPGDQTSNLLMIGTGTGIAPFRSLIKTIYDQKRGWQGRVRLFYGARNGLELLYMNEINDDLCNYYDQETFEAFQGMGTRPLTDDADGLKEGLKAHIDEAWELLQQPNTHVFLAGMKKAVTTFDKLMSETAGSEAAWEKLKKQLIDEKRWSELTYH